MLRKLIGCRINYGQSGILVSHVAKREQLYGWKIGRGLMVIDVKELHQIFFFPEIVIKRLLVSHQEHIKDESSIRPRVRIT